MAARVHGDGQFGPPFDHLATSDDALLAAYRQHFGMVLGQVPRTVTS